MKKAQKEFLKAMRKKFSEPLPAIVDDPGEPQIIKHRKTVVDPHHPTLLPQVDYGD